MRRAALVVAILLAPSGAHAERQKEFTTQKEYNGFSLGMSEAALNEKLRVDGFRCDPVNRRLIWHFPQLISDWGIDSWCQREGDRGTYGFRITRNQQEAFVSIVHYAFTIGRDEQSPVDAFLRQFRWMTFQQGNYGYRATANDGVDVRLFNDPGSSLHWRVILRLIEPRFRPNVLREIDAATK